MLGRNKRKAVKFLILRKLESQPRRKYHKRKTIAGINDLTPEQQKLLGIIVQAGPKGIQMRTLLKHATFLHVDEMVPTLRELYRVSRIGERLLKRLGNRIAHHRAAEETPAAAKAALLRELDMEARKERSPDFPSSHVKMATSKVRLRQPYAL